MNELADTEEPKEKNREQELAYLETPDEFLTARQRRWLEPPGMVGQALRTVLYAVNWTAVRLLFRLRVEGVEHLPEQGPYIIAPNHTSSLDPFVLSTAMGYHRIRQTAWAGRRGALLENPVRRFVNRLAHAIPIRRNATALAVGAAVLQRGRVLVWFPEGTRSENGQLLPFKRGVGVMMDHFQVPAIPAYIHGAYDAMPRHIRWPHRLGPIRVAFGPALHPQPFQSEADRDVRVARMVAELRERVVALGENLAVSNN